MTFTFSMTRLSILTSHVSCSLNNFLWMLRRNFVIFQSSIKNLRRDLAVKMPIFSVRDNQVLSSLIVQCQCYDQHFHWPLTGTGTYTWQKDIITVSDASYRVILLLEHPTFWNSAYILFRVEGRSTKRRLTILKLNYCLR